MGICYKKTNCQVALQLVTSIRLPKQEFSYAAQHHGEYIPWFILKGSCESAFRKLSAKIFLIEVFFLKLVEIFLKLEF